ncbi:MAG: acetylglutamate kinase [Planctomycetes bacterium]|jgi:acetylglutamate/LysW-gamma-L-alpha-aminoadipate kinase|nr:acetylglutamate kinase [Planctomycetota bacterium]
MSQPNERIVVKIGGAKGIDMRPLLDDVAMLQESGVELVLVHGGSDETNRLQELLGTPARFLTSPGGQVSRHTDREALEAFAMATALVNRRLVEGLQKREVRTLGLSGFDGRLLRARRKGAVRVLENDRVHIVRGQWTGMIEGVDTEFLEPWLAAGYLPVIAPLAAGREGEMLNVDGDRAAAALASALGAARLVILTNVPGLLADPQRPDSLIEHLGSGQLDHAMNVAQGRMRKKVLGAREALEGGVERVVLADARREAPITFALRGGGTTFGTPLEMTA